LIIWVNVSLPRRSLLHRITCHFFDSSTSLKNEVCNIILLVLNNNSFGILRWKAKSRIKFDGRALRAVENERQTCGCQFLTEWGRTWICDHNTISI
jgi:hypothetical protein